MENLVNEKKTGWENMDSDTKEKIFKFADEYMYFLNNGKTEREIVNETKEILEKNNFVDISSKEELKPGDKVYYCNRGKSMYIAVIGEEKLENGLNIVGAHVDSPRLDLKPNPIYEDTGFAYFKTHYYGGIKKYQWTTIPLSIHGTIVKSNGEKIMITVSNEINRIL